MNDFSSIFEIRARRGNNEITCTLRFQIKKNDKDVSADISQLIGYYIVGLWGGTDVAT